MARSATPHRLGPRSCGRESGQASVELVAAIPFLVLALLVAIQLLLVGFSLWSAGSAARAGARAAYVGQSAPDAARQALPAPLRESAEVDARTGGPVQVQVQAPSVVPGAPRVALRASAGLGAGKPGGD